MIDFTDDQKINVEIVDYEVEPQQGDEAFSLVAQKAKWENGSGGTTNHTGNERSTTEEIKISLPPLSDVQAHVRRWEEANFNQHYNDTVRPLYRLTEVDNPEGKKAIIERIAIMDLTHDVQETGQVIHNIGTQHDKNPQSEMNMILRKRVQDYLAQTPPEQQYFMLEGWNIPEEKEMPQKFKDRIESGKKKSGETDEEACQRVVRNFGEQGVGLFYALQLGVPIDLHTEISQEKEVEAFKAVDLAEGDIAAFLIPKYLDIYKQGNEFKPEDQFTQEQMFEALSRVAEVTGWKRDELDSVSPDQQGEFIAHAIAEANIITQREIGKDILSADYRPQYRFANELANYRDRSEVVTKMFNISGDTRDRYIAGRVYKAVQEGKSPFLIFGDSHTFKIDPALEYLASNAKLSEQVIKEPDAHGDVTERIDPA